MLNGPSDEPRHHRGFAPAAIVSLLAVAFAAFAAGRATASPVDELLRYVQPDVGFCFVARDLRGHGAALADSPFVAGLRKTPAGKALVRADELARLEKVQEQLQQQLGLEWSKLVDDIFGDAFAFAYRPGPPGKPDDEEGLILIRARAEKPLADFVNRLNEIQKGTGEVKEIGERSHRGVTYFCRVERDKPASYYCLRGPVLLLSGKEAMLTRALDVERSAPAGAEPPVARELRLLGADRSLLSVWVNPRAFDAELEAKARSAGASGAGLRTFLVYWKALDGAAVSLTLDKEVSLAVAARGRPEQLPSAARKFLAEAARPSDLWRAFPDRVLVAAAVRIDAGALLEVVNEFLPAEGRPAVAGDLNRALGPPLGKDFVKEVLPCLGPDAGFCLYAPPPGDKAWSPQGFAALKVSVGDTGAPVDQAVLSAVDFFAKLAVLTHNAKDPEHPVELKVVAKGKREATLLTGEKAFPPGIQPTFGLHGGYLVAATSPEAFHRFNPGPAPETRPGEPTPLLRIGLKEWRDYLKERGEALTQALADKEGLSPDVVRGRLDAAAGTLELFDRLEVSQRVSPGQVALTVTLRTTLPLRK